MSKRVDSGTATVVSLTGLKRGKVFDKKTSTIAKNLVERLLPFFIAQDYACPEIVLSERDGSSAVRLNDFVSNEVSAFIQEIDVQRNTFTLKAFENEGSIPGPRVQALYA